MSLLHDGERLDRIVRMRRLYAAADRAIALILIGSRGMTGPGLGIGMNAFGTASAPSGSLAPDLPTSR